MKRILILIFTYTLITISVSTAQVIEEMKNKNIKDFHAPQASLQGIKIVGSSNSIIATIDEDYDDNGNQFGVFNLIPPTSNPNEPGNLKFRLWKDQNETLNYSGDFTANQAVFSTIRIINNAGAGKVLTSSANGQASWQTPTSGGSIDGLSDGKAPVNSNSVYLGSGSGENDNNSSVSNQSWNTALGIDALKENGNNASEAGEKNTAIGFEALKNMDNNNGNNNTAIGYQAHLNNNSGKENTAIGAESMKNFDGGFGNTAIGYNALKGGNSFSNGNYNTAIGYNALADLQGSAQSEGNYNIAIGYNAARGHSNITDELFIQNNKTLGAINPLIWGDFNFNKVQLFVRNHSTINKFWVNNSAGGTSAWSSSSDERLKKNISTITNALEKVKKLRGVNFEWKQPEIHRQGLQMGFIAQESVDLIPEVVDSESEFMAMEYAPITALLVEAVKEQQKIIENLKKEKAEIKNKNSDLEERLSKIESLLNDKKFAKINN